MREALFQLIKFSLWKDHEMKIYVDMELYKEMKKQAISALPASHLSSIIMDETLRGKWKNDLIHQIAFFTKYTYAESRLPVTVPYVILKGSAAAKYYPHPEYRCMGDIDIMTKREDFPFACEMMKENHWQDITTNEDRESGRHIAFRKNGIIVEVHAFFASMNDPQKAKLLDDYIVGNINSTHYLPDPINGLVLIDHINQHLEYGLGLRQIIDWMMFVDKCLTEEQWGSFHLLVREIGLEKLAITITRMCEMYLGLVRHKWASGADEKLCAELMDYIFTCGNFGNKIERKDKLAINRAGRLRNLKDLKRQLQIGGEKKWIKAKNPILRPFSWLWQGVKYLKETPGLTNGLIVSRKQNKMLEALEVKRRHKGIVYYKNGEYCKKE